MKTIEVGIVEIYVKGVLHSLDLIEHHLKDNNQHAAEIELSNAKSELIYLLRELEEPKS